MISLYFTLKPNNKLGEYTLINKLGQGTEGQVWKVIDKNNSELCLKISKTSLQQELNNRYELGYNKNFCNLLGDQGSNNKYYWIPLELKRNSLNFYFNLFNNLMTIEQICNIGKKLINILKIVHEKGYIYRDISTKNILYDDKYNLFLTDFSFSIKYTERHNFRTFSGTPLFASLNVLKGGLPTYWDDLESLGYMLVYLIQKGELQWYNDDTYSNKLKSPNDFYKYAEDHDIELFISNIENTNLQRYVSYIFNHTKNNEPSNFDYDKLTNFLNPNINEYDL